MAWDPYAGGLPLTSVNLTQGGNLTQSPKKEAHKHVRVTGQPGCACGPVDAKAWAGMVRAAKKKQKVKAEKQSAAKKKCTATKKPTPKKKTAPKKAVAKKKSAGKKGAGKVSCSKCRWSKHGCKECRPPGWVDTRPWGKTKEKK
eukprot:gene13106-21847_t